MVNSNKKVEIDHQNIELIELSVQTKAFLVDSIDKTWCKWAIDNFTKYSDNNLIILLIMNKRAKFITYMEESLIICYC